MMLVLLLLLVVPLLCNGNDISFGECANMSFDWSVTPSRGFHRVVSFSFAGCEGEEELFAQMKLPRDVFVDRFEIGEKHWSQVAGQPEIDLEVRADEAVAFSVAFQLEDTKGWTHWSFPLHLRYPSVTNGPEFDTLVELKDAPRVFAMKSKCQLRLQSPQTAVKLVIPCGRDRDTVWVLAVAVATALLGCAILIGRLGARKQKTS